MFEEHENFLFQNENNVVLNENCVEGKPCINRERKSIELKIKLHSYYDINMKLLPVVTPLSIYQCRIKRFLSQ